MNFALFALTIGTFAINVTELVIMGLLLNVSQDLQVSISAAGLLISGYALGVVIGAPILTALTLHWPKKRALMVLMMIFTVGNLACAIAPNYSTLMAARVLTALAHGAFFGIGSIVAISLVPEGKRASAVAIMFMGATFANVIGVPAGTWLGQVFSWRMTFWAVTGLGLFALLVLAFYLPAGKTSNTNQHWSKDIKAMREPKIILALLTTVFGFAGVFAVFTYIAPILTEISKLPARAVSPILLLFGLGLIGGNLIGGKFADKNLRATVIGTLLALSCVLVAMYFGMPNKILAVVLVGIFGAAAFATVAPLQLWVLSQTAGAGQTMAASLNIAAFNLGNALGAWLGGLIISSSFGLTGVFFLAASLPLIGIGIVVSRRVLCNV